MTTAVPEHTLTSFLANGMGSCAAIIATVLALAEPAGDPFEAVILHDHVLLAPKGTRGVYHEVLDRGRRLCDRDLERYGPAMPGGPIRVDGRGFVPYYMDNLAARLADSGDGNQADQLFRKALALAPRAARIHYNYGTFLLGRGDHTGALVHLDRALHLGWHTADAHVNRGAALWALGRPRAARRAFERALRLDPRSQRARANLLASSDAAERADPD